MGSQSVNVVVVVVRHFKHPSERWRYYNRNVPRFVELAIHRETIIIGARRIALKPRDNGDRPSSHAHVRHTEYGSDVVCGFDGSAPDTSRGWHHDGIDDVPDESGSKESSTCN